SAGYSQPARDRLASMIEKSRELPAHQRRGLALIVAAHDLSPQERAGLVAAASLFLDPDELDPVATIAQTRAPRTLPEFVPVPSAPLEAIPIDPVARRHDLLFDNGHGGFTPDGREYQVYLEAGRHPPAPWVNVMANPDFGAIVSEGGLGCTWAENSSEHRLTPWYNDPVTDRCGEACFLRDEESAAVWSPTPLPLPGPSAYRVSHGAGYSRFEHNSHGLEQVLTVFVDPSRPLKFVRLSVRNRWPRVRRLTATLALEWVLGNDRQQTGRWLVTGLGAEGRVLTVRNAFDRTRPEHTAFLTATLPPHGVIGDRGAFLGRARNPRQVPAALRTAWPLSVTPDAADPCGAYRVHLMLGQDETLQVTFVIGQEATRDRALELARGHMHEATIDERWNALGARWEELLGSLQIDTPDAAWNLLGNRWLLYQGISCRLWGRSGFYQPGGAIGFRDQLQDVLALLHVEPGLARAQLLRAASVQFPEGDVLHWWHAAPLRGVRSRCSDDLLWMPFATAAYVLATGDVAVLSERVAYLAGEPLKAWQVEQYAEFPVSPDDDTLYEHCCRAIEARLSTGDHGLPPIGTGDWNDGFSRVGLDGRGESVWMAWFMIRVCRDFAPLCAGRGETERGERYLEFADRLAEAANGRAWDGEWFLRGFYDDGAQLGGKADEACQIDLNAQAWAVLASAAPRERQVAAMESVARRLVDPESRVLKLLAPPFDQGERDPGYIRGYPPGIRENGSQYNHAAVWAVWAAADLGWHTQAREWFDWIHPVLRAATTDGAEHYALEPYAIAGDISGVGAMAGRGGWSWYTGSASWLYRVLVERLLGIERQGGRLRIRPCLPEDWPRYRARLKYGSSRYELQVDSPFRLSAGPAVVEVDGQEQEDEWVLLVDDGGQHRIVVRPAKPAASVD
ncbi:MAG: hypothetical protein H6R27_2016, partial [Proteobacteria bacterium]|nr:hypothetical protein [Pseudomonadota bacterium]